MSARESLLEAIIEPELPIIDSHHHLWDRRKAYAGVSGTPLHAYDEVVRMSKVYLFDQLLDDLTSGHNIVATVFMECRAMYRADGPPEFACIGETEFVGGVAAMFASGLYGPIRGCVGIVGRNDFQLEEKISTRVLEAQVAAGDGRLGGVRHSQSYDDDLSVLGPARRVSAPGLYGSDAFRASFPALQRLGLSFDACMLEPQLPELIGLARTFPDTPICLDHVGTPLGAASYAGRRDERFPIWRGNIRELAKSPNVVVKLGGLAMPFVGLPSFMSEPPASSEQLAAEWRPYIETCIEAFGVERCMFESNFPMDRGACSYATLWNAMKRLASGCSAEEKTALFQGTASRFYRLDR